MAYFENLVYRYEYERAVREGYLVDYDVVKRALGRPHERRLPKEGEQVDQIDPDTGTRQLDLLEDERAFDATEVERKITAPDSNRKILEEIKRYADEHEREYGRFPKTLIFAANDLPHTSHADQLVDMARDIFGRGEAFVAKITGRVDRPLQRIREFRNRPNPGIVVTVDLLTTGVDIPDLEFLVFLRPVKSRILFEQMLGRGTRKGDRHPDKSHFVVFDCFDGTLLEYFRKHHRHDRRAARGRRQVHHCRSSRRSGRTGTATTTSVDWSSASSASPSRCPAMRTSCSRASSLTATWARSPRSCRPLLRGSFGRP